MSKSETTPFKRQHTNLTTKVELGNPDIELRQELASLFQGVDRIIQQVNSNRRLFQGSNSYKLYTQTAGSVEQFTADISMSRQQYSWRQSSNLSRTGLYLSSLVMNRQIADYDQPLPAGALRLFIYYQQQSNREQILQPLIEQLLMKPSPPSPDSTSSTHLPPNAVIGCRIYQPSNQNLSLDQLDMYYCPAGVASDRNGNLKPVGQTRRISQPTPDWTANILSGINNMAAFLNDCEIIYIG